MTHISNSHFAVYCGPADDQATQSDGLAKAMAARPMSFDDGLALLMSVRPVKKSLHAVDLDADTAK